MADHTHQMARLSLEDYTNTEFTLDAPIINQIIIKKRNNLNLIKQVLSIYKNNIFIFQEKTLLQEPLPFTAFC